MPASQPWASPGPHRAGRLPGKNPAWALGCLASTGSPKLVLRVQALSSACSRDAGILGGTAAWTHFSGAMEQPGNCHIHWALMPCFKAAPATQMELKPSSSSSQQPVTVNSVTQMVPSPAPPKYQAIPTECREGKCGEVWGDAWPLTSYEICQLNPTTRLLFFFICCRC